VLLVKKKKATVLLGSVASRVKRLMWCFYIKVSLLEAHSIFTTAHWRSREMAGINWPRMFMVESFCCLCSFVNESFNKVNLRPWVWLGALARRDILCLNARNDMSCWRLTVPYAHRRSPTLPEPPVTESHLAYRSRSLSEPESSSHVQDGRA
jgi:hypothetical protein